MGVTLSGGTQHSCCGSIPGWVRLSRMKLLACPVFKGTRRVCLSTLGSQPESSNASSKSEKIHICFCHIKPLEFSGSHVLSIASNSLRMWFLSSKNAWWTVPSRQEKNPVDSHKAGLKKKSVFGPGQSSQMAGQISQRFADAIAEAITSN